MRHFLLASLIGLVTLVTVAVRADDEPKAGASPKDKIVGTWRLKSARYGGRDRDLSKMGTSLKHITPSQFMWASYDEEGKITRAAGGAYTLKGDSYEEMPEYGLSEDFGLIKGKPQTFTCKIDGTTWLHNGKLSNGLTIEEVWERVERK